MAFTIALCLVCVVLNALVSASNPPHKYHWVFLHYHKTGHDLSRHLAEVFQTPPCNALVTWKFERRVDARVNKRKISKVDIARLTANEMPFDWSTDLLIDSNEDIKVIHFVREPYDMVVSAYLYHSQEHPPKEEGLWLFKEIFDPCKMHDMGILVHYIATISRFVGANVSEFYRRIMETKQLCQELVDKALHVTEATRLGYNALLRSFKDPIDGVLLEAARSFLSKSGGDLLRMAANAIYETESNAHFPIGDRDTFRRTTSDMYTFLMRRDSWSALEPWEQNNDHQNLTTPSSAIPPFWTCLNISEAVERALGTAYVPHDSSCNSSITNDGCIANNHLTQVGAAAVSKEQRQSYVLALRRHALLAPLLEAINQTLHYF